MPEDDAVVAAQEISPLTEHPPTAPGAIGRSAGHLGFGRFLLKFLRVLAVVAATGLAGGFLAGLAQSAGYMGGEPYAKRLAEWVDQETGGQVDYYDYHEDRYARPHMAVIMPADLVERLRAGGGPARLGDLSAAAEAWLGIFAYLPAAGLLIVGLWRARAVWVCLAAIGVVGLVLIGLGVYYAVSAVSYSMYTYAWAELHAGLPVAGLALAGGAVLWLGSVWGGLRVRAKIISMKK